MSLPIKLSIMTVDDLESGNDVCILNPFSKLKVLLILSVGKSALHITMYGDY